MTDHAQNTGPFITIYHRQDPLKLISGFHCDPCICELHESMDISIVWGKQNPGSLKLLKSSDHADYDNILLLLELLLEYIKIHT
jgi:hypothetical protein